MQTKIEYIGVDKLKSHPDNPRLIKDEQFKVLCESIKANPDYFETRPILANKDGVIFAGNMRFAAAKEIGLKEVPAVIMDIPEERQREIMIRDNISNGNYNFDTLANNFEFEELVGWGFDKQELEFGFGIGGDKTAPPSDSECIRCDELKKEIEGHKKRTGHDVTGNPKQ